jgi:hypothetical protein
MREPKSTDRRGTKPAPGFQVERESDVDPEFGRFDRWLYRGRVNGRTRLRAGISSEAEAMRCSWVAYDGARAMAPADYDANQARPPGMQAEYVVPFGSWAQMEARLLALVIEDAGSSRRASKAIGVARSTLTAWVRVHKTHGRWPRS